MGTAVPVHLLSRRLLSDQLTPVLAYRRLVAPDDRTAPSFLFESVEGGASVGRWSMLGAQPAVEVLAREDAVEVRDRRSGSSASHRCANPLELVRARSAGFRPVAHGTLPGAFHGGWVGYCAFDAVRWLEPAKLPFAGAPRDDRGLPDMHFGMYREVAVFDHATKVVHAVVSVPGDEHGDEAAALRHGNDALDRLCARLVAGGPARIA